MADDIVERLSDPGLCMCDESQCHICAAKAEVERLRVDIEAIHENALVNIERLRAERDAERSLADWLAHALADHMRGEDHPAYTEWEARRG